MKFLLSIVLISAAFALAGCSSLQTTLSKVPPNSFDKIEFSVVWGPFNHTTTLIGGEKQSDGSVKIKSAMGMTTFMGWGSHAEATNLVIVPVEDHVRADSGFGPAYQSALSRPRSLPLNDPSGANTASLERN